MPPRTQPRPQPHTPHTKKTSTGMENSSSIDFCIQWSPGIIRFVSVYVRPTEEDIELFLKGSEDRRTYRFDGIKVNDLNERVKSALESCRKKSILSDDFYIPKGDVFSYFYFYGERRKVQSAIEDLHQDY